VELVHLLSGRRELERLRERVEDVQGIESAHERDARLFVAQLLGVAAGGDQQQVARGLREANDLPFIGRVNAWLRRELERTVFEYRTLAETVDGVCWPVLQPDEPDPLETLHQAAEGAALALQKPQNGPFLSPNPAKVVERLWGLVVEVAYRTECPVPEGPGVIRDAANALRFAEWVRGWCQEQRDLLADPRVRMLAAIQQERNVLERLGKFGASADWQAGVNRLWERWRELFPLEASPKRPDCRDYHAASDAVDELLRALHSLDGVAQPGDRDKAPANHVLTTSPANPVHVIKPTDILDSLFSESETAQRQEEQDRRDAEERARRRHEHAAHRARLAEAFDQAFRFTNEETQQGRAPSPDGFAAAPSAL
jgi:hypothetical protein